MGVEDVLLQRFTQAEDTRGEFVCNYAHGSLFAILHAPSSMHIQTSPNSQIHGVEILFPDSFFLLRISDVSGVSNQFIVKVLRR